MKDEKLDEHSTWLETLESVSADDVQRELSQSPGRFRLNRLLTLVSPAAETFLEEMAQQAQALTTQRFGRTIQLYAPLYVSNYCVNRCRYCGFNSTHDFDRRRLTVDEAVADAGIIASEGFRHILLVSGEDRTGVPPEYFCALATRLRGRFSSIWIEIYPLTCEEYARLFAAGIDGVALYQETYDRSVYADWHQAGPKSAYDHRLDSPDRFAQAGMRRIGLGVLLGLADWRAETLALSRHAAYLMKKYWKAQVSFSFPRIRPAYEVCDQFDHLVGDTELVQMMLALRLCFADAGIVLSTRESAALRDRLTGLCVTSMSAGSKTNPGGYTGKHTTEQFTIDDSRTPALVAAMIRSAGREAVWKDWDTAFSA
ncbi:MAG: 2-iminoacetate synthase ThiH [Sedimentisphaerales bacterium]|nr:2-iminoacetate synthase ThiH [Sedimentisphaerales bacterium]